METRKIQKVGSGTFTVSLPKGWAKSEEINSGSVVNLHTHIDGVLVIQAREEMSDPTATATVQVDHKDADRLEGTLRAAYDAGFGTVVLEAASTFTDEQRRAVSQATRNLTGVTVDDESETCITVRTLLDATEVSVGQTVRQLRFVTSSMFREATTALVDAPTETPLTNDDGQADRLYAMVDRHFARGMARFDEVDALGLSRPELFELREAARELSCLTNQAERIADAAAKLDDEPPASVAGDLSDSSRQVQEAVEAAVGVVIGDADASEAETARETCREVRAVLDNLEEMLVDRDDAPYRLLSAIDGLRQSAGHVENIASLGLRTAIRRESLADE